MFRQRFENGAHIAIGTFSSRRFCSTLCSVVSVRRQERDLPSALASPGRRDPTLLRLLTTKQLCGMLANEVVKCVATTVLASTTVYP